MLNKDNTKPKHWLKENRDPFIIFTLISIMISYLTYQLKNVNEHRVITLT